MTKHYPKTKDNSIIIDNLLKNGETYSIDQQSLDAELNHDIATMDAATKNKNITRDSKNRSKIALTLTYAFVFLAAAIIILGPIYNATIGYNTQIKVGELLEVFNSVFGVVLGFVLGYYFKDKTGGKHDN